MTLIPLLDLPAQIIFYQAPRFGMLAPQSKFSSAARIQDTTNLCYVFINGYDQPDFDQAAPRDISALHYIELIFSNYCQFFLNTLD